jgi:hypothetical protein
MKAGSLYKRIGDEITLWTSKEVKNYDSVIVSKGDVILILEAVPRDLDYMDIQCLHVASGMRGSCTDIRSDRFELIS